MSGLNMTESVLATTMDLNMTFSYFTEQDPVHVTDNETNGSTSLATVSPTNITSGGPSDGMYLKDLMNNYTIYVYGYISPILVLITIITNILISLVLVKPNMRSPTNTVLLAMALSDMLTGTWPIPCFIYFYTLGYYKDWVPYKWCYPYNSLTVTIPTIFHTASIWLTMALAVQRYVCVCHSLKAKQWCTIPNVMKGIAILYFISISAHFGRLVDTVYFQSEQPSMLYANQTVVTCGSRYVPFVQRNEDSYFQIYFWFRVIFIHLVPCTSLVVLNALLIRAMRTAQRRRKQLLKQNRNSESRKLQESNCTTLMLVAVVGVFLLGELPSGIFFIIIIMENTFQINVIEQHVESMTSMFLNLFILLSYPINFFIYCGMSRQFRETFKRLFVRGAAPLNREHSQYMSLATDNEAKTFATIATENGGKAYPAMANETGL